MVKVNLLLQKKWFISDLVYLKVVLNIIHVNDVQKIQQQQKTAKNSKKLAIQFFGMQREFCS